jgi:hypothetical protein
MPICLAFGQWFESIADHRAQLTSAYRRAGLPCPFVVVTEFKPVETGSVAVEAILDDLKRLWRGMNLE